MHLALALAISSFLSLRSYKKSLTASGSIAAFIVGFFIFNHDHIWFTAVLLLFYFSSSALTKVSALTQYGAAKKIRLEQDYIKDSKRNAVQVFCNGFLGTLYCFLDHNYGQDCYWHKIFVMGYIGHFSCCMGDTWSSELGILNTSDPILITTGSRVPPGLKFDVGTNGGISFLGTGAALAAGLLMGLVSLGYTDGCLNTWSLFTVSVFSGLVGSVVDSILGATVQASYWDQGLKQVVKTPTSKSRLIAGRDILDNHQVNFLSSLMTSLISMYIGQYLP